MGSNMSHNGGDGNSLIPMGDSDIGGQSVRTVNLRDLHSYLENGDAFSSWVKDRIGQYGFAEGQDFVTVLEFTETVKNGRTYRSPRTEYHGTIDMAKELAMVERNEKGKQARLYFIECERRAKEMPTIPDLSDPLVLQHLLADHLSKRIEAERRAVAAEKVAEAATETVAAFDRIANAEGKMNLTLAAKNLQVSPHWFMKWCDTNGWTYKRGNQRLAYQDKINAGYLDMKTDTVQRPDGSDKAVYQVFVTPKGLARLAKIIGGSGAPSPVPPRRPHGLGGSAVHAPSVE
ncbi:MAG: phage antirepressor KilAC domain-containing protein [Alphaproteobacteria bacterium]